MVTHNTSQRNDVILFAQRIGLFILPLVLLLAFPVYVFVKSGEGMSTKSVIAAQISGKSPILFGAAYGNSTSYYKLRYLYELNPDVIALGTSRALQFRSGFFTPDTRFLNAGGSISRIEQFREFLDKIPRGKEPSIILIGLDQNFFDPSWRGRTPVGIDELSVFDSPASVFLNSWTKIYRDYYRRKFTFSDLDDGSRDRRAIGLNARRNGNGFRNDGSYRYGYFLDHFDAREAVLAEIRNFDRAQTTDPHLQKAPGALDEASIKEIESFLQLSAERNIHIVGFLPPYPPSVYAGLLEDMEDYPYIFTIFDRLRPLFAARGFSFYDFSDSAAFWSNDAEMIDLIHGSEKTYTRLFLKMVATDSKLASYAAVSDIERRLKTATSTFALFPD
ncbi:MAG TPA: hypothetical protein DEF00_02210 [Candidatus Taylorbacteria bacterium]|nr:MAG: hypothetical protein UY03_C0006G0026 [Parcubacteria group bacterium GW2011_GWA2_47_64]KKU96531.1 MAG: hypothetical protein UY29_C0010G0036 [Parcubacteria group bacterium GW2011_GWC2_48_17]HBV01190.1 hypothetical protein [Candidatus Taylorbacteria bacterium]